MTDTLIAAKIAELDGFCTEEVCFPGAKGGPHCDGRIHRLARELALTMHERVLQRISDMQGQKIDLIPEGVGAALPLEPLEEVEDAK